MITVKFTSTFPEWPILRQTPGGKGVWGDCRFVVNQPVDKCDWWVVYEGLQNVERVQCYPEKTIYVESEPPSIRSREHWYLNQFAYVVTCQRDVNHPNVINKQQALPWHIGRLSVSGTKHEMLGYTNSVSRGFLRDYDGFKREKYIPKSKLLSVISSDKAFTQGHRKRLEFVRLLKGYFGDSVDIFGHGIRDIDDKWNAIADYKYHIVIENSSYPDYWTEKLADCYLAGAYPFYYGCPNLSEYFPPGSFTHIDIDDQEKAMSLIESAINSNVYEDSIQALSSAKELVLDKHNLFAMLAEFIGAKDVEKPNNARLKRKSVTLRPCDKKPFYYRLADKARIYIAR